MNLTGQDFANSHGSVFTAEVVCPWCDRTAKIDIGPQHRNGSVDLHCQKCSKFSNHFIKTADQWFDQHNEKLQKERQVWKRIPAEAYVTCRRSSTSGASFVYTVYLGKEDPTEYFSRDSAEHQLIKEFGMSWAQANSILISAGLTPGQRIYMRHLTKISSDLENKKNPEFTFKRGNTVKINGREALFLRYSSEGFAVVAYPGVGDAEVPVVELEVLESGDSPEEVGFDDFSLENSLEEEMMEADVADSALGGLTNTSSDIENLLNHEMSEGGEQGEVNSLETAVDHLQQAAEALSDFVTEEVGEVEEAVTDFSEDSDEKDADEDEKDEKKEESDAEKEARVIRADIQDRLQSLHNIINDPNTDPQTLQVAQKQLQEMKKHFPRTINDLGRQRQTMAISKKSATDVKAWWYKAPWEFEHMERPKATGPENPDSITEESGLYPKENDAYPKKLKEDDKTEETSTERGTINANMMAQQKVHHVFNQSGDLKKAIAFYRNDLSIKDIRQLLSFYKACGKIASTEADDLGRWFIGTKPRLLSAGVKTATCTCTGVYDRYCEEHGARENKRGSAISKKALLDRGMGIFQPALYRGKEVLVMAIDNTGGRATVQDGQRRQFQVDVADLKPTKTGPYTGKPRG